MGRGGSKAVEMKRALQSPPYLLVILPFAIILFLLLSPSMAQQDYSETIRVGIAQSGSISNTPNSSFIVNDENTLLVWAIVTTTLCLVTIIVILTFNINKRKKTEAALQESKKKYSSIVENIPGITYRCALDKHWTMFIISEYAKQLTGYPSSDFINNAVRSYASIIHHDDTEYVEKSVHEAVEAGKPWEIEYRILHKNGEIRWVYEKGRSASEENGNIKLLDGVILDITDRKQVEEDLHKTRVFLESVTDGVIESIMVISADYRVMMANKAAKELHFGEQTPADSPFCYEIIHNKLQPCSDDEYSCILKRVIKTKKSCTIIHTHTSKDGHEYPVEILASPIFNNKGEVTGIIEVGRDISERLRLEEELLKVQKLESTGILAGGIAHNFNNLLMGILGNISLAKQYAMTNKKVLNKLDAAEKASIRAQDLTKQLLTFSKGGEPVVRPAFVTDLLKDSILFTLSGSNVKSKLFIAEDLWPTMIDEGQISQVIQNVIKNADQAMPDGGIITIRAENKSINKDNAIFPLKAGNYVMITIQDTGIGILPEHIPKVFDPYFSTKNVGSGLGLASCYSIIKNHKGFITIESSHGKGTTVLIYLPIAENTPDAPQETEEEFISLDGKILIMDDEQSVIKVAVEMLSFMGFSVEIAKDGNEAISLYQKACAENSPFDAVILDLTIPGGMGGKETINKLLEIDPDVKAIVSSGYANDPIMADYSSYGFKDGVAKPYSVQKMYNVLRKVLASNLNIR